MYRKSVRCEELVSELSLSLSLLFYGVQISQNVTLSCIFWNFQLKSLVTTRTLKFSLVLVAIRNKTVQILHLTC